MDFLYAVILGVVEGLTEFLPISSTGHLIVAAELLGATDERWKVFNIVIQTGAMLAVVWEYRARFFRIDVALYRNLIVAFMPAAVLGLAFSKYIKSHLFHAVPVALAFIVGGVIILLVERRSFNARVEDARAMTWLDALKVGIASSSGGPWCLSRAVRNGLRWPTMPQAGRSQTKARASSHCRPSSAAAAARTATGASRRRSAIAGIKAGANWSAYRAGGE